MLGIFDSKGKIISFIPILGGEVHAIHGNAWQRAWEVRQHERERATLVLVHDPSAGDDPREWPFAYRAEMTFTLGRAFLDVEMTVANIDDRAQPVGLGFHPFFSRREGMTLEFSAHAVWINGEDHLPIRSQPPAGLFDFKSARAIGDVRIDNCYAGWQNTRRCAIQPKVML